MIMCDFQDGESEFNIDIENERMETTSKNQYDEKNGDFLDNKSCFTPRLKNLTL